MTVTVGQAREALAYFASIGPHHEDQYRRLKKFVEQHTPPEPEPDEVEVMADRLIRYMTEDRIKPLASWEEAVREALQLVSADAGEEFDAAVATRSARLRAAGPITVWTTRDACTTVLAEGDVSEIPVSPVQVGAWRVPVRVGPEWP